MTLAGAASDHITPYDRLALDEATLIALLAAPAPNEGLVEYFGAELHAELVQLARATLGRRDPGARRVYVLPGIMGSQLGFARSGGRPKDVLWLDPIDFQSGRLTDLKLGPATRVIAMGAMNYSYLKLTLSLRAAGFDAQLLDYDWRRDLQTLGKQLAERIAADGYDNVALLGHSMGGLVARAALTHSAGQRVSRLVMLGTPNSGSLAAVQALRGNYSVVRKLAHARPAARRRIPGPRGVLDLPGPARVAAGEWRCRSAEPVRRRRVAGHGPGARPRVARRGRESRGAPGFRQTRAAWRSSAAIRSRPRD